MKIAIIQFAPLLADLNSTIEKLKLLLLQCTDADLIILPELANSGYNFADQSMALKTAEMSDGSGKFLAGLLSFCNDKNTHIVTGFNELDNGLLYNSAILIGPTGMIGKYRKLHLFMNEKKFFQPGNLGLPIFEVNGVKIGMLICFDWMFPEAWRILALKGAQLICHPSNLVLPYAQKAVTTHAINNRIFIATANRIGTEGDLTFTGQSVIVAPNSEYLAQGSAEKEEIIFADIDPAIAENKNITPLNHAFADRRTDVYGI